MIRYTSDGMRVGTIIPLPPGGLKGKLMSRDWNLSYDITAIAVQEDIYRGFCLVICNEVIDIPFSDTRQEKGSLAWVPTSWLRFDG